MPENQPSPSQINKKGLIKDVLSNPVSESKFTVIEIILMLILTLSSDAAEALGTLGLAIPAIGPIFPIVAWFYGQTISAIIIFWLIMKGVSFNWFLGGSGIELIPILNTLPARTIALIITIAEDKFPPLKKVTQLAKAKIPAK
ncbi:MAG: hypothetical protein AAB674_03540 [Patescibacteria group bacterium]